MFVMVITVMGLICFKIAIICGWAYKVKGKCPSLIQKEVFDISREKKHFVYKKCPNNGLVSEKQGLKYL